MEHTQTERLIALLRAQRDEASHRASLIRNTTEWMASSARLDGLNDQIIHTGPSGNAPRELVGDGLELELDSRPVEDTPFRRLVVESARQAVIAVEREGATQPETERAVSGPETVRVIGDVVRRTQATLRTRYPKAILVAGPPVPEPGTITLRADRDGAAG